MKKTALEEIQESTEKLKESVNDLEELIKDQGKQLDQMLTILAVRK